jgi:protein O-mannose beta-1,4-N-acetylglucosaminyltransferase
MLTHTPCIASRHRFQPALVSLSSAERHNIQYLHYDDLPASALETVLAGRPLWMVGGLSHLFRRFKPDNVMHAVHDDILPLFSTLKAMHGGGS